MTYQLSFYFKLAGSAVFSNQDGDPNSVQSEGYIPGSAVWGALAALFMRQNKLTTANAHANEQFRQWFLRGGLTFLNCYPRRYKAGQPYRLLPLPFSLGKDRDDQNNIIDLVANNSASTKKFGGFGVIEDNLIYTFAEKHGLKKSYHYHTTRNVFVPDSDEPKDKAKKNLSRLRGRADEDAGGIFVYEALERGQEFEGIILGTENDLKVIKNLLEQTGYEIRLGRSKATQYGGAIKLEISEDVQPFKGELAGSARVNLGNKLVVTLTSHLLLENDLGYPSPDFPKKELAEGLKVKEGELKLVSAFVRRKTVGGYSAVWQLPRSQWSGFEVGSVFVFEVTGQGWENNIASAEEKGLGLRTGEGFGRFVLNRHGEKDKLEKKEEFKNLQVSQPTATVPASFVHLTKELVKQDLLRQAEASGIAAAKLFFERPPDTADKKYRDPSGITSLKPALIARLEIIFREIQDFEAGQNRLQSLKKIARESLERARNAEGEPLFDILEKLMSTEKKKYSPKEEKEVTAYQYYLELVISAGVQEVAKQIGWNNLLDETNLQLRLVKKYLEAFFRTLSRKLREERRDAS
jgi:CRISPR-associated protein Csx10